MPKSIRRLRFRRASGLVAGTVGRGLVVEADGSCVGASRAGLSSAGRAPSRSPVSSIPDWYVIVSSIPVRTLGSVFTPPPERCSKNAASATSLEGSFTGRRSAGPAPDKQPSSASITSPIDW